MPLKLGIRQVVARGHKALAVGSAVIVSRTPTGVAPNSAAAFPLVSLARFPCIPPTTGADLKEGVDVIRVRELVYREPRPAKAALHASDSWSGLWLRKQWPACSSPGQSLSISDWHAVRTGPWPCVSPPEPLLPCWPRVPPSA
jgi:hypothetical protein